MRILYIHQYFTLPDMAGGARSYEFARRLARNGHEVHVLTSDRESGRARGRWRHEAIEGIHLHWLPVPYANEMSYENRIRAFLRFAVRAALHARRIAYDIVFATSTPLTIAIPGVYAARLRKTPMVFEVRDLWPNVPIAMGALRNPLAITAAKRLEAFAYRNARRIIALSDGMRDGVVARGYPPHRIEVIPNCCDIDLFDVPPCAGIELRNTHAWLGSRPLVVYIGALGLVNGIGYLVRLAAAMLNRSQDICFAVIGAGREEPDIRQIARDLGVLGRNFFMMGPIPRSRVPNWLSAADVGTNLVIDNPALRANSANKFFDTLAAGKPVAVNIRGWQADLLERSGAGLVLDARDHAKAAETLAAAIVDKPWRERASSAARRLARERFNQDTLAARFESLILDACGEIAAVPAGALD